MKTFALAVSFVVCFALSAQATLVVLFEDEGDWDGAGTGTVISGLTDPMTSLSGDITIGTITGGGVFSIGGTADAGAPIGYGLGVFRDGLSPADPELFNVGESGSFSWNVPTEFAGVTFRPNFQLDGVAEMMTISSPDWAGHTPGALGPNVSFVGGTFTFASDGTGTVGGDGSDFQSFDASDLGGVVPLPAGSTLTITKIGVDLPGDGSTGGSGELINGGALHNMSFNVVPEVSSFLFGSVVCSVLGLYSCRRNAAAREAV